MRNIFLISILCALSATCLQAQEMTRYELNINDFLELKVIDGINVDYKCVPDSAGKAVFTTTPDMASVLMLTNRKGKLEVQISTDGIDYLNLPTITVYSRFLVSVDNNGDSLVRVVKCAPVPTFRARLVGNGSVVVKDINASDISARLMTGNGQLVLHGSCQNARLSITGTGSIQADELKADDVKCSIVGTGTIGCFASNSLSTSGTGTGKVYYSGSPETVKTHIGGIKAIPLDGE